MTQVLAGQMLFYQSEVFNRPHVDQQDPRNLSSFEFRPPDAMIRDRRSWHTETHQEASFHRSGRIQRRRKSHLDDIYGPNYEDNYRAERYRRFKPEHRTLTSIKSYTPKKFDYSTRREISKTVIDSPKQSTKETADKNSNSESVSSSRINFNANKIAPDEENANEANKNSQCSDSIELKSTNKCFSLGTDRASTNFTKQAVELDEIESCEEDYENSTKENREKCGKDEIKSNEEDQQKVTKEDEQKVTKLDEENSIKDEIPTSSTSLPVPFPVANNEPKPLSPKSDNFHTEVKNNIQIEVETSITIHHDDAGVITATYLTEHSKAIQDEFEKEMESDETISLDDSITIDQIDTGKSFLEDTFELADDYRVIDMDVDTPSPAKRRKLDSTIETKLEPNELYPVIECEQLLNELTFVINGKCDNEIVENTNKKKESSLSAGSEKYPVIQLNQPQDSNNPSKISAENNKTKEKSIEYIQDTSLKNTRSKPKQKDKRKSENCHPEEIKNVRRKSREPSKNNKMSTNYYPALANYTIPKSSDADCKRLDHKQYEEKCGNRRKSSKHVSGSTKISTPAEEKRRGHEERRSKSSRTELPEANSKSHTNKETGRDHIHKKSLNGKLSSKSERYEKIEKSHAKKVIANNEIKNNLAKSVDGKRRYSETGLHPTTGLITERRHSLQVSDKVSVNEKAMELYQKDKSEKLEIQIKLTRFVNAITEQSVSEKNEEDCIKLKMEQNTEKHVFCSTAQENNVLGATTDVNKLRDIERTMEEIHSVESSSKVKMPIEDTVSPNPLQKNPEGSYI
ncbi:hypothetical protein JTB14_016522 [Gonioctena quinquepunctata]|nr:hypothetical protein JTB14_016522 [Gonioctena quinquepunctata]